MPKKGSDKRKGRRTRTLGNSNNSQQANSKASPPARGRSTNNSRHGRKPPPKQAPSRRPPNKAGKRRNPSHSPDQPIFFTSDSGELYKPGDFAYVDSQRANLPYHICLIKNFKLARKESVVAEVKWFYRVSELPEAVYLLLMEDRKNESSVVDFELPDVKDRELFVAFNNDTHPAGFFRGKCQVKELQEVKDLADYISNDDNFFFQHGYKPESRRLTKMDECTFIPHSQQAFVSESMSSEKQNDKKKVVGESETKLDIIDRYKQAEELVWKPGIEDEKLLMYLRAARSIALHAGICMSGLMRDGYMAASSDETTQHAFDVLHHQEYDIEKGYLELVKKPIIGKLHHKKNWSKEHSLLFAKGMRQFGKNFHKIKKELLPHKEIPELIEYYYYWKKTTAGLSSRSTRKQRKQIHIRMSKVVGKPSETPEREFVDFSSADEDEIEHEELDKCYSFHACRHCFSTESPDWHHAGIEKAVLCQTCRLYFRRYGCMRPLSDKQEPPNFMYKDYHTSLAEEEGRKTRNSNGVRIPHTGLRSGKVFSKSDSDEEEGEVSDTSEFSSTESSVEMPINSSKALQPRHSLLDLDQKMLHSSPDASTGTAAEDDDPPAKRQKTKNGERYESDDCSEGTTIGDTERDRDAEDAKLPDERHSPALSFKDNHDDDITFVHGPTATTPSVIAPLAKEQSKKEEVLDLVPQQFKRVSKDTDSTCARTDLEYVHPPPEVRRAIADPQKAVPTHIPQLSFGSSSQTHSESEASVHNTVRLQPPHAPTISSYDPRLPVGPISFSGLTMTAPHPMTPLPAPPGIGLMGVPLPSLERDGELMLVYQQQQQQQLLLQKHLEMQQQQQQQQQQQLHSAIPFHPHAHPPATATTHSSDPTQPVVFQFPSADEVRLHRLMSPQVPALAAEPVMPHSFHPMITSVATPGIPVDSRAVHDENAHIPGPIPIAIPANSLEALQQQAMLMQLQHVTPENFAELRHHMNQEYQKNPNIILQPQFQAAMQQMEMQQHYLQEMMLQQEAMKQQHLAPRPGVIMNSK